MRKLFYISCVTLLFSCSSDDGGSSIDQSLLMRKWYIDSYVVDGVDYPYQGNSACGSDYTVFKTGNVVEEREFGYDSMQQCEEVLERAGTWSVSGNEVTITYGSVSRQGTVTELTSETLKINGKIDTNGDGVKEDITEIYTSTP